jgi:hypothetical protein
MPPLPTSSTRRAPCSRAASSATLFVSRTVSTCAALHASSCRGRAPDATHSRSYGSCTHRPSAATACTTCAAHERIRRAAPQRRAPRPTRLLRVVHAGDERLQHSHARLLQPVERPLHDWVTAEAARVSTRGRTRLREPRAHRRTPPRAASSAPHSPRTARRRTSRTSARGEHTRARAFTASPGATSVSSSSSPRRCTSSRAQHTPGGRQRVSARRAARHGSPQGARACNASSDHDVAHTPRRPATRSVRGRGRGTAP